MPDGGSTQGGAAVPPAPPGARRARRKRFFIVEGLAIALVVGFALAAYAAWRLSVGTLPLTPLTASVERALSKLVGEDVEVASLRLGWDGERGDFVILASGVTAFSDARDVPLDLGEMDVTLDPAALLRGKARVKRASLRGLQASLARDAKGHTSFGFGGPEVVARLPRKAPDPQALGKALAAARAALSGDGPGTRVESVIVEDSRLTVFDVETGARLELARAEATLSRTASGGIVIDGFGLVKDSGGGFSFTLEAETALSSVRVQAAMETISPSKLKLRGIPLWMASVDLPLSGAGEMVLDGAGAPVRAEAQVSAGRGRAGPVPVNSARARIAWSGAMAPVAAGYPPAGQTFLSGLEAQTGAGQFRGGEMMLVPQADGGVTGAWRFDRAALSGDAAGDGAGAGLQGALETVSGVIRLSADGALKRLDAKARFADAAAVREGQSARLLNPVVSIAPAAGGGGARGLWDVSLSAPSASARSGAYSASAAGLRLSAQGIGLAAMPATATLSVDRIEAVGDRGARAVATNLSATGGSRGGDMSLEARASGIAYRSDAEGLSGEATTVLANVSGGGAVPFRLTRFEAARVSGSAPKVTGSATAVRAYGVFEAGGFADSGASAQSLSLLLPGRLSRPFEATGFAFEGSVTGEALTARRFEFAHRTMSASGSAMIAPASKGSPRLVLDADIRGDISVGDLMAAWPLGFLDETGELIRRLVVAGRGTTRHIALDIPAGILKGQAVPDGAVALDFEVSGAEIDYLPGMSTLKGVSGAARLTGNRLAVAIDGGRVGSVAILAGSVDVPQFQPQGETATFTASLAGDATEMALEADRAPLRVFSQVGFDPARLTGNGEAVVTVGVPIQRHITPEAVSIEVSGEFYGAGLAAAVGTLPASDGEVRFVASRDKVAVEGKAYVGGSLFDFVWSANPSETSGPPVRLAAQGTLPVENLQAFGFDASRFATGTVGLTVNTASHSAQIDEANVVADLTGVSLRTPGDVWVKAPGVPATLSGAAFPREGGGWSVRGVLGSAPGASVRGGLELDSQLNFQSAEISRLSVDAVADLSASVAVQDMGLSLDVRGRFLNLGPLLARRDVSAQAADALSQPLTLTADIEAVGLGGADQLDAVSASMTVTERGWTLFDLSAMGPEGLNTIALRQEPGGQRTVSGALADAGLIARLVYPTAPLTGGRAIIEGVLPVAGSLSDGALNIAATDVLVSQGSGAPLRFDTVTLPMQVSGEVLSFKDARASGSAYNVKASGYVDLGGSSVSVNGVATPGGLNRAVGALPVVGTILAGGADEGMLGITFQVRGPLAEPVVRTNVLSVLAPGLLRRVFESPAASAPLASPLPLASVRDLNRPYGPGED